MSELLDRTIELLSDERLEIRRDGDGRASFDVEVGPLPWTVHIVADDERQWLVARSLLPVLVPVELRTEMAVFVARANFGLVIGNFELDIDGGEVRYKTSLDVNGLEPSRELIRPVFLANISTMNRYLSGALAVIDGADAATAVADVRRGTAPS